MRLSRTDRARRAIALGAAAVLVAAALAGGADQIPPLGHRLSGGEFSYAVRAGDSWWSIGARYGVATGVLARANHSRPGGRLRRGQVIQVDNRHIVPDIIRDGILINVPQRMLFLLRRGNLAAAYPVGLGRPSWRTARGEFSVMEMREHPVWHVPESIQEEMAEEGKIVKEEVAPGPDNPLGDYFIALSLPGHGIHGTIAPLTIYDFRTHGCIRLHPDDAAALFKMVKVGDPGEIVYEPVMLARLGDGRIFLEVHRDIYNRALDPMTAARNLAGSGGFADMINWAKAAEVVSAHEGVARDVTAANPSSSH